MDKTRSVKYPQITEADYAGKLVSELDDRPQLLPSELKARFDALGKEVIIPAVNTIAENVERDIEELNSKIDDTGGDYIQIVSFDAETGTLVTKSADYEG